MACRRRRKPPQVASLCDRIYSFSFKKRKNRKSSYEFSYKLSQSIYNYLSHIVLHKKKIGYGSIRKDGPDMLQYRIRDSKVLSQIALPIFHTYRLHTTKNSSYTIWKSALLDTMNREVLLLQRNIPDY
nr:hypothetical protein [Oedogonium sp. 244]